MQVESGTQTITNYYQNSQAIIIGIGKYKTEQSLSNAVNDAEAIKRVLEHKYNFKTTKALFNENATYMSIMGIFLNLLTDEEKIAPKDRLVIYYSGHGKLRTRVGPNGQLIKRGYIIPYDFESDNYALAVPMEAVVEACQLCPAKHTLLILDCCYSGYAAARGDFAKPKRITSRYLDHISKRRAVQLFAAGEEDEPVADSGIMKGYSAFTGALLSILEPEMDPDGDGILTASEVGMALKHQVSLQESGSFQNPVYTNIMGHENGDLVFKIFNRDIEPGPVSDELDIDKTLESAKDYFSYGSYELALENVEKVLRKNILLYTAHDLKGSVLSAQGKYNEALASFDEALRIMPNYHRSLISKGIILLKNNEPGQALKVFSSVVELYPNNATGWYYRGVALWDGNKREDALFSFDKAIAIKPDYLEALNARKSSLERIGEPGRAIIDRESSPDMKMKTCIHQLSSGEYLEANKCFDEVTEMDKTADVQHNKGIAMINLGLYHDAIKCFEESAIRGQYRSDSYYAKALSYYLAGKYDDAVGIIKKLLKFDPKDSEAWKFGGLVLHNLYRYSEAKEFFEKAVSINSKQPDVWYNLARIFSKFKKYPHAIESYNEAIKLNPRYSQAWNNKGNLLTRLERYADAIKCFDRAASINPNDAIIWYNKGNAFLHVKDPKLIDPSMSRDIAYERAIVYYDKATTLNPNYPEAWNNKAVALNKLGRNKEARASLEMANRIKEKFHS
jgi:tetratricopeptide (TPR) repeat protein